MPVEKPQLNKPSQPSDVSQRIWLNGEIVDRANAAVGVYDHGMLYGDGVFEGIRAYAGRLFKLRSHLRRLFNSAKAIRLEIPYTLEQLERACRDTLEANNVGDAYIRLCVTRGEGTLGLHPFKCHNPTVFVIAGQISLYPAELYENGMEVITAATVRNHPAALSPRIKSMNYLNNILAKIEAIDAGVLEAVMLNSQGCVAECTGDNICIIRERGGETTLLTPPLHAGCLEGVTLDNVMQIADEIGLGAHRSDLTTYDLYSADEMFLTGTAAEIMPVTTLDGRLIGTGEPGPWTRQLSDRFRRFVERECPED